MKLLSLMLLSIVVAQSCAAQTTTSSGTVATNKPVWPIGKPFVPAELPGKGLAQHDFLYSGEAKEERMFIVRVGRIVWDYTHPASGEISDTVLEANGNILFAHQHGVTDITADNRVQWRTVYKTVYKEQ